MSILVSQLSTPIAVSFKGPVKVSGLYVLLPVSIHKAVTPNRLESTSAIYGYDGLSVELTAGPIPESNPYRATIPESILDLSGDTYDYMRENQEILREQHNLTQAGDTTFPWQLFIKAHTEKLYTLGAIGRFYHESFGIIRARYVQFDSMDASLPAGSPVGFLATQTTLDWVVTNRLSRSNPFLVLGVSAPLIAPADGEYGWIIVDGPNLQELANSSETHEIGESFGWAADGSVSNASSGLVIGRRVAKSDNKSIPPGALHVHVQSFTLDTISDFVATITDSIKDDITGLENDVELLKQSTQAFNTLKVVQATLVSLESKINSEIKNRRNADAGINNRIAGLDSRFVTANQMGAQIAALQNSIGVVEQSLKGRIAKVEQTAAEALRIANGSKVDLTPYDSQISAILEQIYELGLKPVSKFPVVDGSVPPILVYLDDGTLVYTESL